MNTASRFRQAGSLLGLAVLCLLALLSFTQCKYGPDKVTGLDRGRQSPTGSCIHQCSEQYQDSLKAENKLHKKNLRNCGGGGDDGDDGGDDDGDDDSKVGGVGANGDGHGDGDGHGGGDPACIALEQARHAAAVARITDGRKQCIESCHHQGGGSGR